MSQTNKQTIYVEPGETTVCCRGGEGALGHPAIYLYFGDQKSVKCYYCGKEFIKHE
ncbi:MAG: zinc-finger domain-containing protein [Pseudomonadota bacterium]